MTSIQTLARPNYVKKHLQTPCIEEQQRELKPTKWDRVQALYKKATDLAEVGRTSEGDEILDRKICAYALNKGFTTKRFVVRSNGKWTIQEKFCYKDKIVESMKLWEIELLFLEL